jgi:seryl-tRNA synthetase
MEACIDPNNGMIADINSCKKFLNTNKDANVAAVTEFGLRQLAQEDILREQLESGDDKVKAYLKEEGFAETQINELSNKENIEKTKEQIIERYNAEKKAIIAEMASRIERKTVSENGEVTNTVDDTNKLKAIQTQLSSRETDLASLVKFNNIVSSYLAIDEGEGKQSRNTASLFAESKTLQGEDAKIFKDNIKNAGLSDKKNSPNLNVDTINDTFLDYDKKPKP